MCRVKCRDKPEASCRDTALRIPLSDIHSTCGRDIWFSGEVMLSGVHSLMHPTGLSYSRTTAGEDVVDVKVGRVPWESCDCVKGWFVYSERKQILGTVRSTSWQEILVI